MATLITIICNICNKPVDEILQQENYERAVKMFRVTCHGDRDYCELSQEDIFDSHDIRGARAFMTKRLND